VYKSLSKYIIFFFSIIFLNNESLAITGKEISHKISEWLLVKGIDGKPIFSKTIVFKDCDGNLKISKLFDDYKTVNVNCASKGGLNLFVRVKLNKVEKNNKIKKVKLTYGQPLKLNFSKTKSHKHTHFKLIKLKRPLEKNAVIGLDDLQLVISKNQYQKSFFNSKKNLVGRKLKKNLKVGQLLHPRHLYENFDIQGGDALSIVSHIGNAKVTVSGEAVDSGNLGDLIKVKNLRSGKIVKGYVKKNKIIRVFR
jgi:flagella basal body P-ring formation protein FlgA